MDYYKPKLCNTIAMEENNRYKIIFALYNVTDDIKFSILFNISNNRPFGFNYFMSESEFYKYLKYLYPYYCEKINA